jgi:YesN/AraC family two-component response regulator
MNAMHEPDRTFSILLVEDEEDAMEALSSILVMKYPAVTLYTATNGKTGLHLFKMHTPDIVVTDINLPELNGIQLVEEIRVIKPDTKIIVLSADSGKNSFRINDKDEFGINHFIAKPVIFGLLFASIEQCIAEISHPAEGGIK